jgi:hypothetical protein
MLQIRHLHLRQRVKDVGQCHEVVIFDVTDGFAGKFKASGAK